MTNIEHMREQIVKTVIELDEMGLLQLAEDTEMNLKENEGIFNCIICETNLVNVMKHLAPKNIVADF